MAPFSSDYRNPGALPDYNADPFQMPEPTPVASGSVQGKSIYERIYPFEGTGPLQGMNITTLRPTGQRWNRLARRELNQGNAALLAANMLYGPTLALARQSVADYGDLWRQASDEQLAHDIGSATTRRRADLADYSMLAPEYIAAQRASNPILGQIYDQSTSELSAGRTISPGMRRELEEYVRAGQATRGMGLGPADVYEEALEKSSFGENLYQQRLMQAMRASGLWGDVMQATLGRPANPAAPQGANIGAPQYGTNMDDLFSYGTNYEIQKKNIQAAKDAGNKALWGSTIEAVGSLAGGAIAACWVAREVFGADSPKWKQFRQWLYQCASADLLRLYVRNGPRLAAKLKAMPQLKPAIREYMEERIAELAELTPNPQPT